MAQGWQERASIMRNAGVDGFTDVLLIALIGIFVLVGTGFAMCKVMGWDTKALVGLATTVLVVSLSFLLVAQVLTFFF